MGEADDHPAESPASAATPDAARSPMRDQRAWVREIIFEADTPSGKLFDVVLLGMILLSVLAVMLESVKQIEANYLPWLRGVEWALTIIFTIEYALRLYAVRKPMKYAFSFFGIIDLLAVVPTYLSLFIAGSHHLAIIRTIRLLRVFRVLKLARYTGAASILMTALRSSRQKITVFLFGVLTLVVLVGSLMYFIEGQGETDAGFTSIPKSIYWAIVTLTTVGYGDITPQTTLGQMVSAALMISGYAIIAVPTGIVSVELAQASLAEAKDITTHVCPDCAAEGHDTDATHCKYCGTKLAD